MIGFGWFVERSLTGVMFLCACFYLCGLLVVIACRWSTSAKATFLGNVVFSPQRELGKGKGQLALFLLFGKSVVGLSFFFSVFASALWF